MHLNFDFMIDYVKAKLKKIKKKKVKMNLTIEGDGIKLNKGKIIM